MGAVDKLGFKKRSKNMKNFFEKVREVALLVTSVKDQKENKEIKILAKD